ncbi:DUF4179 domain-containing protein [Lutispora sp.]|uniref:DUF4179 domain-containing protein n=1 Tax=Lutispora sp. TaxID=2828727 RepID=UPI002B20BF1E|nr:hypothetical protein [Lutispora sp.]MEA4962499.1 hypothetical protein [Lutispora sp.]
MNKGLLNLKEEYAQIEIPPELKASIQIGIERGRKEVMARYKNVNAAAKICAAFIIAVTLFTGAINISPSFADALKNIPIVGKLVKVLQFTDGKSGGGKITDGTDISNIGITEKDGYENIIINFSQDDELQGDVGAFKVRYEENPYTMSFEIGGARRISAKESFERLLKSKYIKDVYTIITLDDSLIRFVIEFEGPVKYEVKEMKEPASIVLSLKEDKQFTEKKMYSLRTKSYPYGESIGILEEKLMPISPARILKDSEGMYFIELQLFEAEEDALGRLNEIEKLNYDSLLIEERIGAEKPKNYPVQTVSEGANEDTSKSRDELSDNGNDVLKSSLYPVSVKEGEENYYGNIEMLDKGLNIYGEDIDAGAKYYFDYKDIALTKLLGEASFKLKIETGDKTIIASGVFSDFFEELEKYTQIKE